MISSNSSTLLQVRRYCEAHGSSKMTGTRWALFILIAAGTNPLSSMRSCKALKKLFLYMNLVISCPQLFSFLCSRCWPMALYFGLSFALSSLLLLASKVPQPPLQLYSRFSVMSSSFSQLSINPRVPTAPKPLLSI